MDNTFREPEYVICENGKEFKDAFGNFLIQKGIKKKLNAPY